MCYIKGSIEPPPPDIATDSFAMAMSLLVEKYKYTISPEYEGENINLASNIESYINMRSRTEWKLETPPDRGECDTAINELESFGIVAHKKQWYEKLIDYEELLKIIN